VYQTQVAAVRGECIKPRSQQWEESVSNPGPSSERRVYQTQVTAVRGECIKPLHQLM